MIFLPDPVIAEPICRIFNTSLETGIFASEFINLVVFLDLARAFDTACHDILSQKLELYGIIGLTLDWIKSYLSNRKQLCVVEGSASQPLTITCGVPQGSILGPLTSFTSTIFSTARVLAENTNITTSCRSKHYWPSSKAVLG